MATLKERVEKLETELDELRKELESRQQKDWLRAVEKYSGDEDLQAVFAEAMKLREVDRKRARGRMSRPRRKPG